MSSPSLARRYAHTRGLSEPALLVQRGSSSSMGREEFKRTVSVPPGGDPIMFRTSGLPSSLAESSLASTPLSIPEEPEVLHCPLAS